MVSFLDSFFDQLQDFSANQWFYAVIFGIAVLDSIIPVVPSETAVILGGIAAGAGDLEIGWVIAAGGVGALMGDGLAYAIGRKFSGPIQRWYMKKPKRAKKLDWAERQLRTRGGTLLLTARFIPGGRTLITLSSGITRQSKLRFFTFDLIACTLWASYGGGLGFFFGNRFSHRTALFVALGASISITILIELVRRQWRRSHPESVAAMPT